MPFRLDPKVFCRLQASHLIKSAHTQFSLRTHQLVSMLTEIDCATNSDLSHLPDTRAIIWVLIKLTIILQLLSERVTRQSYTRRLISTWNLQQYFFFHFFAWWLTRDTLSLSDFRKKYNLMKSITENFLNYSDITLYISKSNKHATF